MAFDINWTQHAGPPRIPAVYAKPLIRFILNQAGGDLDPKELALVTDAGDIADLIEVVLMQRDAAPGIRAALLDFVNGWSSAHGVLHAVSRVPASLGTKGARAAKLLAVSFPEGLSFTQLPAVQAWAYGDRLVSRLHEGGIDRQIDELIGADHLRVARRVTTALGEALGVGRTPVDAPDPAALQKLLGKFQRAMGRYSRVMLATVDEEDPASIERFRRAVVIPIERYRSGRSVRDDHDDANEPTDPGSPPVGPGAEPDAPADPSS